MSADREKNKNDPHTCNIWVCDTFKRKIAPTQDVIRTGQNHLKLWLVETSADGKSWPAVTYKEDNRQLNGSMRTGTFPGGGQRRVIRLVSIGRNFPGDDTLYISAPKVFGNLVE
jgi:hypothetical protein